MPVQNQFKIFMIDTLRINLIDAEIKRSSPIQIQKPIIDYSTGKSLNNSDLFIDNHGKIVTGAKAFLNADKFNLTINPTFNYEDNSEGKGKLVKKSFHRIENNIQPDIWDPNYFEEELIKGIFVQTSLPRLLNENNFKQLTKDQEFKAIKKLQEELAMHGIIVDVEKAKLSRVDTFTNIKTDLPFYSYSPIFNLMECSRLQQIAWSAESFLWRNKEQQIIVYDKIKELLFKHRDFKPGRVKNIMRIENRLLKKRKVTKALKFLTVGELLDNYQGVKDFHRKEVHKKLFKYSFTDIKTLSENKIENQLIFCRKQFGDKWLDGFIKMEGVKKLLEVGSVEFILDQVERLDSNKKDTAIRMKKSRIKKMYNDFKIYIDMFESSSNKKRSKTNIDLYNELKTKFYKLVA